MALPISFVAQASGFGGPTRYTKKAPTGCEISKPCGQSCCFLCCNRIHVCVFPLICCSCYLSKRQIKSGRSKLWSGTDWNMFEMSHRVMFVSAISPFSPNIQSQTGLSHRLVQGYFCGRGCLWSWIDVVVVTSAWIEIAIQMVNRNDSWRTS